MIRTVTYGPVGEVARIVIDDGEANVMSIPMLHALHSAFDQAQRDKVAVALSAVGKHFSAGFDLGVFANGGTQEQHLMLRAGAELALRILSFPTPVVTACQGSAYAMGALLIVCSDYRIGSLGDYRIRMSDATVSLTVPRFVMEIARRQLAPSCVQRAAQDAEMFPPEQALAVGLFHRIVPPSDLERVALEIAATANNSRTARYAAMNARAQAEAVATIRRTIEEDLNFRYDKAGRS